MVRVVKVNGLRTPEQRAGIVYVGRAFAGWPGHPLGNPYKAKAWEKSAARSAESTARINAQALADCLTSYRNWLLARPTIDADMVDLWEATDAGAKSLGCWCVEATAGDGSPVVCHAQILAEMLRERFAAGG